MTIAPAFFISHGSPLTVITEDAYAETLRAVGRGLRGVRAVVVVSAHGLSHEGEVRVTGAERPPLVYDFGGFPPQLYAYRYPCPGAPALAREIASRLEATGLRVGIDPEAGLDHGVWVPLARLFPEADVPVVQVSLPFPTEPERVLAMGAALAPMRDQGVVLVGSGGAVHNLRALNWHGHAGAPDVWAAEFNRWLMEQIAGKRIDAVVDFQRLAPNARMAHPTTEHFFPIFFTLGAWREDDRAETIVDEFQYESLSMYSFRLSA